jgi:hypothetical protein
MRGASEASSAGPLTRDPEDHLAHIVDVPQNLVVPEPQNPKAASRKLRVPNVIATVLGMLAAVHLHDEAGLEADEIDDEGADRRLPSELQPVEAAAAQLVPQLLFRVRLAGS